MRIMAKFIKRKCTDYLLYTPFFDEVFTLSGQFDLEYYDSTDEKALKFLEENGGSFPYEAAAASFFTLTNEYFGLFIIERTKKGVLLESSLLSIDKVAFLNELNLTNFIMESDYLGESKYSEVMMLDDNQMAIYTGIQEKIRVLKEKAYELSGRS